MPAGTDLNSDRSCETPGRLKARLRTVHPRMKQPVFQRDTVWTSTPRQAEDFQRLGFNADLAPSDFRPFPRFKNVSEGVTTLRKVKLGQRLCCDSLNKAAQLYCDTLMTLLESWRKSVDRTQVIVRSENSTDVKNRIICFGFIQICIPISIQQVTRCYFSIQFFAHC